MSEVDKDILLTQYKECYEYLRQHSRFIWQVPSIAAVISGGLVITTFAYVPRELLWVQEIVLLVAVILNWALLIAVKKHRYFSDSEAATLSRIEDALKTKRIQRPTLVSDDVPPEGGSVEPQYWNIQTPEDEKLSGFEKFFRRRHADRWLGISMLVLSGLITMALILNPLLYYLLD